MFLRDFPYAVRIHRHNFERQHEREITTKSNFEGKDSAQEETEWECACGQTTNVTFALNIPQSMIYICTSFKSSTPLVAGNPKGRAGR